MYRLLLLTESGERAPTAFFSSERVAGLELPSAPSDSLPRAGARRGSQVETYERYAAGLEESSASSVAKLLVAPSCIHVDLLCEIFREIVISPGISDFNFISMQNHTSAALGSHRGSFGSFADLVGLFLASNLPGR